MPGIKREFSGRNNSIYGIPEALEGIKTCVYGEKVGRAERGWWERRAYSLRSSNMRLQFTLAIPSIQCLQFFFPLQIFPGDDLIGLQKKGLCGQIGEEGETALTSAWSTTITSST